MIYGPVCIHTSASQQTHCLIEARRNALIHLGRERNHIRAPRSVLNDLRSDTMPKVRKKNRLKCSLSLSTFALMLCLCVYVCVRWLLRVLVVILFMNIHDQRVNFLPGHRLCLPFSAFTSDDLNVLLHSMDKYTHRGMLAAI